MEYLYSYSYVVFFLIGVAIVFLASEFGYRLGVRTVGHGASGNISALEQSLLGFLALMVGFTFLMALTRFETRREAVLNEANAIGTAALRARLLPEPHRAESLKLLREYAQIRVDYIPTGKSFAELPNVIDRSNIVQEALWQQVKALSAEDHNMVPTGLFILSTPHSIDLGDETLGRLFGSLIAGIGLARGKLDLDRPHVSIGNLIQQMPDAVEPSLLLVIGVDYVPRSFLAVGVREHHVLGLRILHPKLA